MIQLLIISIIATLLIYWFVLPCKWRNVFLLAVSLVLIASCNVGYAVYFIFSAALVYKGGILIEEKASSSKNLLTMLLFWLIGNLCFFKYGQQLINIIPNIRLPAIVFPLGLSYITFRLIHYIVEISRKGVPRGSFVDFLLYVFFFPTFLAGPVDRFGRFEPQAAGEKKIGLEDVNSALYRIICGAVKKFVIADNFTRFIMPVLHSPQDHSRLIVGCAMYGLAFQIYMDFAGYTDMALGISKLFGYKIMENFDRPFLKTNIALYWRSWHISMYSWIRDYFFLPLFGYRASEIKIYVGIFCSMIVFMLWHKGSMNFLMLGIYHGLGLVIWQLFQEIKRKFPWVHRWVSHKCLDPFSTFITFTFVSIGFLLFAFDLSTVKSILTRLF